jgi:hypothetical protein
MTRLGPTVSVAVAAIFGFLLGDSRQRIASLNLRELWTENVLTSTQETVISTGGTSVTIVESKRKPKLGDGCYHVYLDVGSNIGVHARFLYEPEKYRRATTAHSVFDKHFGKPSTRDNRGMWIYVHVCVVSTCDECQEFMYSTTICVCTFLMHDIFYVNTDFCVFTFEPNPVHAERHAKLAEVYGALGWRYVPIPAGVADKPGNLTFYRYEDGEQMEWGFSTVDYGNAKETVVARVLRLSDWVRDNIEGRLLPEQHNSTLPPKVVMKMDIEGLEVRTMTDMLLTGTFCNNIDYAFGEYHGRWSGLMDTKEKTYSQNDQNNYWKALMRSMKISENCRGYMEELDDEKYLTDPKPYPEPPVTTANLRYRR